MTVSVLDRIARRERAAGKNCSRAHGAVAAERAARIDEHAGGDRAVDAQGARVDEGRAGICAYGSEHGLAGAELHDLTGAGDRAVEGIDVGAIEHEHLIGARIAQRIASIAAERDIAENAAVGTAVAELQDTAEDTGAAGIGGVAGNSQHAGAVFVERARKARAGERRSVGQERCIGLRVVIGETELQHRRLREVAGDVVEGPHAAAECADGEHVDGRIVEQRTDLRVRQPRAECPPIHENSGRVAVGDGDRALRIGDVVEAADDERVDSIVRDEFEHRGPDDMDRQQIGREIGKRCALVPGAEQVGVVGHEVPVLRARIEHDVGRLEASSQCVVRPRNERTGSRGALRHAERTHYNHVRIVTRAIRDLYSIPSIGSRAEIRQREIDRSRGRVLGSGQRVLSDVHVGAAKRHASRVDTVVHPTGATEIRVVGASDKVRAFAMDSIKGTGDLSSNSPAAGLRAEEVPLRVPYDSSGRTKILSGAVEHASPACCKRHVIHEEIDAVCSHHRVPQRCIAARLDGDTVVLCRRG